MKNAKLYAFVIVLLYFLYVNANYYHSISMEYKYELANSALRIETTVDSILEYLLRIENRSDNIDCKYEYLALKRCVMEIEVNLKLLSNNTDIFNDLANDICSDLDSIGEYGVKMYLMRRNINEIKMLVHEYCKEYLKLPPVSN